MSKSVHHLKTEAGKGGLTAWYSFSAGACEFLNTALEINTSIIYNITSQFIWWLYFVLLKQNLQSVVVNKCIEIKSTTFASESLCSYKVAENTQILE